MSAAGVAAEPAGVVQMPYAPVQYASAPQVVTYGAAPQMVYSAAPQQFATYAAQPVQQVVYMNAPEGQPVQVDEHGQVIQTEGMVMEAQPVTYLTQPAAEAPQVVYVDEQGNPVQPAEGADGQVFMEPGQMMYSAPPPARINVSPEIFAKLAAGGVLTPEEMAQLSGQAPEQAQPEVPAAAAAAAAPAAEVAAVTSAKASKKKSSSKGSKKALKASKKKKAKGCC